MRGRLIYITNFRAECPYCKKINTFRLSNDPYGILVGAIDNVNSCKHLINWYRKHISSGIYARFEKNREEVN